MTLAFDAVGPASPTTALTPTSITWSHTCSASANRLLLAGFHVGQNSGSDATKTISGVTYNGVAMTSLGVRHANDGTAGYVHVWALVAPASGANNIVATFASAPSSCVYGSLSFTDVDQTTAWSTPVSAAGDSATSSVAVTSNTSGNIIAFFVDSGNDTSTNPTAGTKRYQVNGNHSSGGGCGCAATIPATGSSVTCSWGLTSDWWSIFAVEVRAVSGAGSQTVTPTGKASSAALGTPTITPPSQTVTPTGLGSGAASGSPTITPPSQTVGPTGLASGSAIGSLTVTPGAVSVSPTGKASSAAIGTPTVTPGAIAVAPTGLGSAAASGTPIVTAGAIAVGPTGLASGAASGSPTVTPGAITVSPTGLAPGSASGSPTITPPPQTVSPTALGSGAAAGSPTVTFSQTVNPTGLASGSASGSPAVTAGAIAVSPTGRASTAALGTPTITPPPQTVNPSGVGSGAASGSPVVSSTPPVQSVTPAGTAPSSGLGSPVVSAQISVAPAGRASTAAVGTPTLHATTTVSPSGIPSGLSIGQPNITGGATTIDLDVEVHLGPTRIVSQASIQAIVSATRHGNQAGVGNTRGKWDVDDSRTGVHVGATRKDR